MTIPALTFDPIDHRYTLTGTPVHSVTQILNVTGAIDFSRVPEAVLAEARDRGTAVHRALQLVNDGRLTNPSGPIWGDLDLDHFEQSRPEWAGYVHSWLALVQTGRLRPMFCEHRVGNFAPRYAGTLDWLGVLDTEAALLDFATGDPADAAKHLQTAAYVLAARAWADMPGEDTLRVFHDAHPYVVRYAVQLHADGSLPTLVPYRDPRDFSTFLLLAHAVNAITALRGTARPWHVEALPCDSLT
jgi:hypothetical protein